MPPQAIIDLVEAFSRNEPSYRSPQYKEAEVRCEFIDPFFECLGWDVQNRRKYAENYKDVVHEPSLENESSGCSAPDYSFQPGGRLKFYVEAKKPTVILDRESGPAHQLRMYGWTKQLPLSVLTNFAEFAVYDCRVEPRVSDSATVARVIYLSFREYLDRWDGGRADGRPHERQRGLQRIPRLHRQDPDGQVRGEHRPKPRALASLRG